MAYGLKYSASAYGLSPVQWKVEIYEKDFTPIDGALPISLLLVGDGLKIGYDREDDRFNVIYSRYAIIDIKVTNSFDLDTLQFDDERKFLIKIYRGLTHEFSGWIIPNYSSQAYEDVSITTITIQAKDSINRLRDIPFADEYPILFSHKQSVKSLLSQSLRKIGYNLDLDIYYNKYEDGMLKTASDCPLSQLFVNVRSFKEDDTWISYYDVIERLLSDHDLRIFQANGRWNVLSPIEIVDGSVSGRRFNYLGEQQSNISLSSNASIGGTGLGIRKSSIIRKGIPIQSFVANFEFGQSRNLVLNGGMENFSDFQPEGWTLSNNWVNGEVAENTGGGIIFRDTYATRSPSILPDVPVNDASLNQNKYLESNQINIERLGTFSLSTETFISEGIDAVRVRIEFYEEGGTNKHYVTSDGKLTLVPTSLYVYNAGTDAYKLLTLTWENRNQFGTPVGFKYMRVRVYEGVRLRSGTPTTTEVKFKNVSISGRPIDVSGNFTGKRIEIKNSELPNSKKYDDVVYYYKDVELFNEPEHVHKLYLNNEIGEEGITTGKWKRTSESIKRKLIESRLVDRLSMTNKFGDIFEGSIYGYIGMDNTPYLKLEGKRLLVLYSEFSLGANTSEIVAIELFANNFTLAQKEYNLFSDNTIIEVDVDSSSTTKINVGEEFKPITSAGGTIYGGLYINYGIDSLPSTSTDPRAGNKGILIFGGTYAEGIQLGNKDNKTLVEILGGKLNIGDSKLYSYDIPMGEDGDEIFIGLGIDAYEFQVDGRISAVGGIEVGLGGVWITKEMSDENIPYGQITATTYINVTAPVTNFTNILNVNEIGGIGENPITVNSEVYFNQPIFITESNEPNSAVTRQQLTSALTEIGEFGQNLFSYDNPNIFDAPFGATYVAGLLTNLPNGEYLGHSIKMSLGKDKPNDATYLAIGLPRDGFDCKIYARGIYDNEDTGWKAIGGDIANFKIYRQNEITGEAEIDRLGYYYEIDKGDKNVFVGFDKTNGDFEIAMMIADQNSDIVTEVRTIMAAGDGRLYYQNGNNNPDKYALLSEIGTGGAGTAYTGTPPIDVVNGVISVRTASATQAGVLTKEDWTKFNSAATGDLNFGTGRFIYWRSPGITDPNNFAGRLFWHFSTPITTSIFTSVSGIIFEADTDMNIGSTGKMNIKGNTVYINGIQLDMAKVASQIGV